MQMYDICAYLSYRMNSSLFIAKRLIKKSSSGFTNIIIKIATATIALGLVVMLCANSVINGFQNEISNKIFGFWGHIHINDTKITRSYESIPIKTDQALVDSISNIGQLTLIDERSGEQVSTVGGVKYVQSYAFCPGILNRRNTFEAIMLKGIAEDNDEERLSQFITQGDLIVFNDTTESRELIISEQTANRLEVKLDDKLIINFAKDRKMLKKQFQIKGIYKTGLEEYDQKFAFCDQKVVQDVLGWGGNQITGYEVFLDDINDAPIMSDVIYNEYLPTGLFSETIQEKRPNIFEWLDLLNINERIIIMLMILVSIINMATVILIFILDRSHMIGVLKAVGYNDWPVRKIFIYQAIWILIRGIIYGNIIAIAMLLAQRYWEIIKLNEASYYLSVAPVSFSLWQIILINVIVIVITTLSLILPTYIITKIRPIKVLEFV